MSETTIRRLVAVLVALLVVCSFVGVPAAAAAGSNSSFGDGFDDATGSDDGDSGDENTTDDGDAEEDDGSADSSETDDETKDGETTDNETGASETDDETEDGETTDNETGASETDDETEDGEADDDENVTEEVVDTVEGTTDETVETVDGTTDEVTYRTLEIVESTTGSAEEDDVDLGLGLEDEEETTAGGGDGDDPDERLSPVGSGWSSQADDTGSAERTTDSARSVDADDLETDDSAAAALSTSGGQPVPGERAGGAALGLGVIAAAAAVRTTSLAASSGAGTAAPGYLSTLLDRFKPFVFPLRYSRYDDSDPLEHDARERVYEIVNETPGSYLSEVSEQADLPLSTTRHHMKVLEREDLVSGAKLRGKRRFYPAYAEGVELAAALNDESTASIIDALARLGAASVSDLAEELDRDPSTISHHLQRLEEDSIIAREREGRAVMNKLSAEARTALEPETTPRPGEPGGAVAGGAD